MSEAQTRLIAVECSHLDKRTDADAGWRQKGECASVMTRQTERMVLAAYLIFLAFYSARADGTDEADG